MFIIDHIHHLINESKMLIFVYNSDRSIYVSFVFQQLIDEVADYLLLHVALLHTFQNNYYFFLICNLVVRNSSFKKNKWHVSCLNHISTYIMQYLYRLS